MVSTPAPDEDPQILKRYKRREARSLFWRGWPLNLIADEIGENYNTVASWKKRDGWEKARPIDIINDRLESRIAGLIDGPLTADQMKKLDHLMRMMERSARIEKYGTAEGRETDLNPNIERRNDDKAKEKRANKKNLLTAEDIEKCRKLFDESLFQYQREWLEAGEIGRIRFILKSRQIGATWYFAREAFMRAMDTGNNQIFLSASKNQAIIFREYILPFVLLATGKELKGNPLIINREDENGDLLEPVTFYFLATNKNTAQGYHGDVYLDEVFWVPGWKAFENSAVAMATQKRYRMTYFSKPSSINHEAYPKWSGAQWNEGRPKKEQKALDISHRALKNGVRGHDDIWRQIVTVDDAIAKGLDLVDREQLVRENSIENFANQYLCEFLDDSMSAFPWALLSGCLVDSFFRWRDFQPALINIPGGRPFGDKSVWVSMDPNNGGGDDAAIIVVAPPEKPGGKFRVLEKHRFTGLDFEGQAEKLREVCSRYRVTDLSIDTSGGMGKGVFELVVKWFPTCRRIDYSVMIKSAMVLKAQNVMRRGRLEYDNGWADLTASLMAIRPAMTASGRDVTYTTSRGGGIGHGDLAWALLGALINEPMDSSEAPGRGGFVVIG